MRRLFIASYVALLILLATRPAVADGGMMPTKQEWLKRRERSYINEPEQKALLYFHKGTEDLIISPSFAGEAQDFAWVVPVPARPKVEIVRGALFHELMKLVNPGRPSVNYRAEGKKGWDPQSAGVRVLEEKEVGAYKITVLSADDSRALVQWLNRNGYHLPEKAQAPVQAYVKEGWTFVASKVTNKDAGRGLRTGTLAPLRFTFPARQPVYPVRLSAVNPKPYRILLYLALDKEQVGANTQVILTKQSPLGGQGARVVATVAAGQKTYPTLAKIVPKGASIFVQDGHYIQPGQSRRDYVWLVPSARTARR